mmetsp:Transcript_4334/g.4463  ORF Transcript_4334/g.4463 Transcript_4334/m.4463 type:complete len:80 (+) Transcript_4334:1017-1256(+)
MININCRAHATQVINPHHFQSSTTYYRENMCTTKQKVEYTIQLHQDNILMELLPIPFDLNIRGAKAKFITSTDKDPNID